MSVSNSIMFSRSVLPSYGKTMNAATQITMYANTILQQSDISIQELPHLPQHQKTARGHAENWLKTIWPEIIQVTKNIIGYAQTFDAAYQALTSLVDRLEKGDKDAKEQFKQMLKEELVPGFQRANISRIASCTESFKQTLEADHINFENDSETAKKAYIADKNELANLQTQEEAAQKEVESLHASLIAASIALAALIVAFAVVSIFSFGLGSGALAAGIAAATKTEIQLRQAYAAAVKHEHDLQMQIQQEQEELAKLNVVRNQLNGFTGGTFDVSNDAQAVADGWTALGDDLDELIKQLDKISPQEAAIIIRTQLSIAHKDWEVVLTQAEALEPSPNIPVKKYDSMESFLEDITPK